MLVALICNLLPHQFLSCTIGDQDLREYESRAHRIGVQCAVQSGYMLRLSFGEEVQSLRCGFNSKSSYFKERSQIHCCRTTGCVYYGLVSCQKACISVLKMPVL